MPKSFKVEVQADSTGTWAGNGLRWPATAEGRKAAESYACDLAMRWTAVRDWRVEDSDDEPNQ